MFSEKQSSMKELQTSIRFWYCTYSGNGFCDEPCENSDCSWDQGDCHQLCDESCLVSDWTNGICNSNCNSTLCNNDGFDCISSVSCDNNCTTNLLNDGYCEIACYESKICGNYELLTDCNECTVDSSTGCYNAYIIFVQISSAHGETNDIITTQDWCNIDEYWNIVIANVGNENIECHNITNNPNYDLNMNGMIGFFEFIYMFGQSSTTEFILSNMDCSFCLANRTSYYL